MLQGKTPTVDVKAIQQAGYPVVVWTVNDPGRMGELLQLGVDGVISDRPDLLMQEVTKAGKKIDAQGHRGGRNLRPENTLPAFEGGLDQLVSTLETDTGVTKDHVSIISHEQFLNPQTCRLADGSPYMEENRIWIKDTTMAEAAGRFICDKVFRGPDQRNDLALSPVAVAFAREHQMTSPYAPTNVTQLGEFVSYYGRYYRSGPGKTAPNAPARARNAETVRFNLETKLTPKDEALGHTFDPETFAETLAGTIQKQNLESRADIQSFDFRTLEIVQRKFPHIRTVYLMESLTALHR